MWRSASAEHKMSKVERVCILSREVSRICKWRGMRSSYSFITLGVRGGLLIHCSVLSYYTWETDWGLQTYFSVFIACTKCSSIPEGGHLCREPQSCCLKEQCLEQGQGSLFQQFLPQSPRKGLLGVEVALSHESAVLSLAQLNSFTTPCVLSSLKTNFHSKVDGFKINYLKK